MANETTFLPRRQADVLTYGGLMHGALSEDGCDPATLGLNEADVAELGTLVAEDQAVLDEIHALELALRARRKALSGPNGTHPRLVAKLRAITRKARVSKVPDAALAGIGTRRKNLNPARRNAPVEAPDFTLEGVKPGIVNLRFREGGSARPRARAVNAIGVEIAVVDAAKTPVAGEANDARIVFVPHSPAVVDSGKMPGKVRLYARWMSRRGETGAWSLPLALSVT